MNQILTLYYSSLLYGGCLIMDNNCVPFASTRVHSRFWWGPCCSSLTFFVLSYYVFYVLSSVLWCPLRFPHRKKPVVRLYLQLFVGAFVSYLRYLCLLAYIGVQHILCCGFALFVFILCTLCCQFLFTALFDFPVGIL
jgi:hypothetical protein